MTMAQYEVAWQHYHAGLTQRMEAEVSDAPAAGDGVSPGASEAAFTAEAFADATSATPPHAR
jgi:hypothetical protein